MKPIAQIKTKVQQQLKKITAIPNHLNDINSQHTRPVAWQPPKHQPLIGNYQKNHRLKELDVFIKIHGSHGPESVAIGEDGYLYTGLDDGRILCYDLTGKFIRQVCHTGGRPLGMRWYCETNNEQTKNLLFVCDVKLGLLQVELATGEVTVLSDQADNLKFGFSDDLAITQDGQKIYFTDASSKWGYNKDSYDHIEHGGHGRFLCYDRQTKQTQVLMKDLCFCNGVTLSPDEDYVLVTETGSYCVHRYWLTGDKANTHEVFIDNLPGFPDNIRYNGRGCYWVAIPVKRNVMLDTLAPYPLLRFGLTQYVRFAPLPISHTAMVLGFDLDGKLLHNLQDHGKDSYHFITQAIEHEGWLYCSSLHQAAIAKFALTKL